MPFELRVFRMANGRAPFSDWYRSLRDPAVRIRIRKRLFRAELGNLGDHKSVGGGVWELRFDQGPGYRIYFALEAGRIVILLIGGDKGSQRRDVHRAKEYYHDYQTRGGEALDRLE